MLFPIVSIENELIKENDEKVSLEKIDKHLQI